MYHRVNTLRPDPWNTCVSPSHFAEHLQVIRDLPAETVITFDDGYADNFEHAKPLLERFDTPAIIFVVSGCVDSPFEMWWDELDRMYLGRADPNWDWDDPDPDTGAARYREQYRILRNYPGSPFAQRPIARPERRMMTAAEVATLATGGLIEIGAHTVTHPVLSTFGYEQQRWEIFQSKKELEEITGREVRVFAYPNGGRADYTDMTVDLVRAASFLRSYAAWDAPVDAPVDPYQIPRVMVRDWDGDTFAAVLYEKLGGA